MRGSGNGSERRPEQRIERRIDWDEGRDDHHRPGLQYETPCRAPATEPAGRRVRVLHRLAAMTRRFRCPRRQVRLEQGPRRAVPVPSGAGEVIRGWDEGDAGHEGRRHARAHHPRRARLRCAARAASSAPRDAGVPRSICSASDAPEPSGGRTNDALTGAPIELCPGAPASGLHPRGACRNRAQLLMPSGASPARTAGGACRAVAQRFAVRLPGMRPACCRNVLNLRVCRSSPGAPAAWLGLSPRFEAGDDGRGDALRRVVLDALDHGESRAARPASPRRPLRPA